MSNVIKTICHRIKDLSITLEVIHTDSSEFEKQIMCWFNEGLNDCVDAVFLPYDNLKEVYNLSYVALVKYLKANSFRTPILKNIPPTVNTDNKIASNPSNGLEPVGVVASEGEALLKQAEVNEVLRKFPFIKRASEPDLSNPYYRSYPKRPLDDDISPAFRGA